MTLSRRLCAMPTIARTIEASSGESQTFWMKDLSTLIEPAGKLAFDAPGSLAPGALFERDLVGRPRRDRGAFGEAARIAHDDLADRLGQIELTTDEYFEITERKTAHLFAAACSITHGTRGAVFSTRAST